MTETNICVLNNIDSSIFYREHSFVLFDTLLKKPFMCQENPERLRNPDNLNAAVSRDAMRQD